MQKYVAKTCILGNLQNLIAFEFSLGACRIYKKYKVEAMKENYQKVMNPYKSIVTYTVNSC